MYLAIVEKVLSLHPLLRKGTNKYLTNLILRVYVEKL